MTQEPVIVPGTIQTQEKNKHVLSHTSKTTIDYTVL